jgi:hypothetical protein
LSRMARERFLKEENAKSLNPFFNERKTKARDLKTKLFYVKDFKADYGAFITNHLK